jgi:hypothetical protein
LFATSPNYAIAFVGGTLTVLVDPPTTVTPPTANPGGKGGCGLGGGAGLVGMVLMLGVRRRKRVG